MKMSFGIILRQTEEHVYWVFYNSVHLLKNARNNLLNSRPFIFSKFHFSDFISFSTEEISWKLLHYVFDDDEKLQANLRKANKLIYKIFL